MDSQGKHVFKKLVSLENEFIICFGKNPWFTCYFWTHLVKFKISFT